MPHAGRDVAIWRLHHQVVVITHQAVRMAKPVETFNRRAQRCEKCLTVLVILIYGQAGIGPGWSDDTARQGTPAEGVLPNEN